MSSHSETSTCPRCDSDSFEVSIDFEEVDGVCNECGYEYHTVTSLMTLEEVNVDRIESELVPLTELKKPKDGWKEDTMGMNKDGQCPFCHRLHDTNQPCPRRIANVYLRKPKALDRLSKADEEWIDTHGDACILEILEDALADMM